MSFFSHNYVKYLTEPCHNDIILLVDEKLERREEEIDALETLPGSGKALCK
jgi:hypothetical protein